jgi:hypothetical protein
VYFIILLGIVSLFGDITYEGVRSVAGPYLYMLGASASVVSLVAGIGGFVGYALRLASGYLVDRTKAYWILAFIGYGRLGVCCSRSIGPGWRYYWSSRFFPCSSLPRHLS